jgi:16S rRNA pseudouridine516 synthase
MRIDRLLGNLKYGTRTEIRDAMKDGVVTVDGVPVGDPGTEVNPETQTIVFAGETVFYRRWIHLMMNKPKGVVSANADALHPTAVGLLRSPYDRFDLSICGRLDMDAEGLLLLTNDGDLLHRIISPKTDIWKRYEVELRDPAGDLAVLERGVALRDGRNAAYTTAPARIEAVFDRRCTIAISEGKFHQVKRMFEAVGNEVVALRRVAIGGLELDPTLPPGGYRELTREEIGRALEGTVARKPPAVI